MAKYIDDVKNFIDNVIDKNELDRLANELDRLAYAIKMRREFLTKRGMNTLENFIEKHIEEPWEWGWYGLSRNPSITPEFIEKHINKPWDWGRHGLSRNPSITSEFIEKHINKPWSWDWGLLNGCVLEPFGMSFLMLS